ncbi:MAG: hypothetical protein IJ062_12640 [Firmicutes bacterium]|nr:hypothetical protein [Bacillota bacterium]
MKFKKAMAFALTGALTAGAVCSGVFADGNQTTVKLTVAEKYDTDYVMTIPADLTVENKGFNALSGLKVEHKSGLETTFNPNSKVTVSATSTNGWQLKAEGIDSGIGYTLKSAADDTDATTSWEFAAEDVNTDGGKTKALGVDVANYDNADAGEYTDTITFTAEVETTAPTKTPANTPNIAQADCTFAPSNGKSTLSNSNITTLMEYSTDNGTTWNDVAANGTIGSLPAGTVQIRVKETDENAASESVSITVPEVLKTNELVGPYSGDKLTVEFYDGETWNDMSNRYSLIKIYSGYAAFGGDGFIYLPSGSFTPATDKVSTSITYEVQ